MDTKFRAYLAGNLVCAMMPWNNYFVNIKVRDLQRFAAREEFDRDDIPAADHGC